MKKIILNALLSMFLVTFAAKATDDGVQSSTGGKEDKSGTAGAQYLKIPVGARAMGMAAYSAVANDLTSIYWNPAGIAQTKGMNADFSYCDYFAKFNHSFAAGSMPVGESFRVAVHFMSFSTDEILRTTIENPEGDGTKYRMSDMAAGITFAGYLTEKFSFGFTGKYIRNTFANVEADGFACDIGTNYDVGLYGMKLAFSLQNLGTDMNYTGVDLTATYKLYDAMYSAPLEYKLSTTSFGLPLTFRAGIVGDVYSEGEHKVIAAADFETIADAKEQFAFGGEYTWNDMVSIRAGYRTGQDQFGFCAGAGVKYFSGAFGGEFNYSFNPTKDFGVVNRIGISMKFGN